MGAKRKKAAVVKRPWPASDESSSEEEEPVRVKRARKDAELGHFSRLSLSAAPNAPLHNGRKDAPHVVYVDSLSDSEPDSGAAGHDAMDSDPSDEVLQLEFPRLLAEKLARIGQDETLLPVKKPELSLVLYRPLIPPLPTEGSLPSSNGADMPAPPSSPEQSNMPLEEDMSKIQLMDLDD